MGRTILFVYGTLKRGYRNHHRIADQEFLGAVQTEPLYRIIDLGDHPGMVVEEKNGLSIRGEIWSVNDCCLAELDEFEEIPGPFIRTEVKIAGREEAAQAYFWNRPIPEGAKTGSEWPL